MTNDPSIFGENQQTPAQPNEPTQVTPAPTNDTNTQLNQLLSSIVSEDGSQKYRDVPTALDALKHSQEYIKQLKAEMEAVKSQVQNQVTMEQILETLKQQSEKKESTTAPSGLTAEDVIRILEEKKVAEAREANAKAVASMIKEVYGEKAEEVFYGKAAELGLSKEAINHLASTSPAAIKEMFGIKKPASTSALPSGINTAGLQEPQPTQIKSAMGYVSDKELLETWKAVQANVNKQLGIS